VMVPKSVGAREPSQNVPENEGWEHEISTVGL